MRILLKSKVIISTLKCIVCIQIFELHLSRWSSQINVS